MASFMFLLRVTERQLAEIAAILATTWSRLLSLIVKSGRDDIPSLAEVEWLFLFAVNMSTQMRCLSWFNSLDALQPFGHFSHVSSAPWT